MKRPPEPPAPAVAWKPWVRALVAVLAVVTIARFLSTAGVVASLLGSLVGLVALRSLKRRGARDVALRWATGVCVVLGPGLFAVVLSFALLSGSLRTVVGLATGEGTPVSRREHQAAVASITELSTEGVALLEAGRAAAAEPLLRECLEISRRTFGSGHQDTWTCANNLGLALRDLEHFEEAEPLLREAALGRLGGLGAEHPLTIDARLSLGMCLLDMGRVAEGAQLVRLAETRARDLPSHAPERAVAATCLGFALFAEGRMADAERQFLTALETCRLLLGEAHAETIACLQGLTGAVVAQERLGDAVPHLRELLAATRAAHGDRHAETVWTMRTLADFLLGAEEFEQAEGLYREALPWMLDTHGHGHPDTIHCRRFLAFCEWQTGDCVPAEARMRECIADADYPEGAEPEALLGVYQDLGNLLEAHDRLEEAAWAFERCAERRAALLGEAHEDTVYAREGAARVRAAMAAAVEAGERGEAPPDAPHEHDH